MGDLITSCFGNSSRNWKLGIALSQGISAKEFSNKSKNTLEGIQTTFQAEKLSQKLRSKFLGRLLLKVSTNCFSSSNEFNF